MKVLLQIKKHYGQLWITRRLSTRYHLSETEIRDSLTYYCVSPVRVVPVVCFDMYYVIGVWYSHSSLQPVYVSFEISLHSSDKKICEVR